MKEKKTNNKNFDKFDKKEKIFRFFVVFLAFLTLTLLVILIFKQTGLLEKLKTSEDIKNFILSGGNFSLIIFVTIQFLQVTILPVPAFLSTVAGALIFGAWKTFVLSFISIILGSLFAFWLGRKFGKKLLVWICGKSDAEKWTKKLTNGKYAFFLMMLFPAFPDDVLCLAAGVTNMSFKFFLITNLITRPIGIFCICFLGSGTLIPYKGYYLILWAIIYIVLIILFVLSIKSKDKIETFVDNFSKKFNH